jgi:hypothetical protein
MIPDDPFQLHCLPTTPQDGRDRRRDADDVPDLLPFAVLAAVLVMLIAHFAAAPPAYRQQAALDVQPASVARSAIVPDRVARILPAGATSAA